MGPRFYLALLLGIAIVLASETACADRLFPDKNLEDVVRKSVFDKRDNDEPLVETDVETISTIKGKGRGIQDLSGLEKCAAVPKRPQPRPAVKSKSL